jgi:hypothetical protein
MRRRVAPISRELSGITASRRPVVQSRRTTIARHRRDDQSGDTLVEVLIALVVLGLASVALIIAFGTSISASADHRQLSASGVALDSISQQVIADMQATPSLFTCPYVFSNYEAATFGAAPGTANYITVPAGFTAEFDTSGTYPIEYWQTSSNSFSTGNPATASPSTCAAGEPQLVTISVTDTSTGYTYNNSFVVDSPLDTVSGTGASVTYGTADQLVFTQNPGNSTSGNTLPTPVPAVSVEDANGNVVKDDLSPVLVSLVQPGGAAVTNGAQLTGCSGLETQGVVTFTGCAVSAQGTYELAATDGDFSGTFYSQPFSVTQATDYLKFTTQPVASYSGQIMKTQPVVTVYSSLTNTPDVFWSGTITLTSSGGQLTNCSSITLTPLNLGVGSFSSCYFAGAYYVNQASGATLATPYTFTASATSSTVTSPATSQSVEVLGAGSASQLVFSTQPTGSASASLPSPFTTQPVVTLEDSFGNIATTSSASVSLSISGGQTLTCASNPVSTSNGSASFSGCSGSAYATGLKLTATSLNLTSATSAVFDITGAASQLIFTTQPVAGVSGTAFKTQPVVTVEDASGETVTASTTAITLASITAPSTPGGILQFCTGLTPYEGVISVQTCTFSGVVGTPYYLVATQGSLSATSGVFSPTSAGAPTQLAFSVQPVAGRAGSAFTVQPVVDVEDAGGNVVITSTATISLGTSGGTLSGCSNLSAVAGVVNVNGCVFGGLDTQPYTLTASSSGLTSATTSITPSGPGPVSATQSTITANPAVVMDNGTAYSTVTVTLLDSYGNVVPGDTVLLAQGATSSVITPNPVIAGSNGTAAFNVTDTTQQIATYSASDVTQSVVLAGNTQVSFAAQLLVPTNVTLSYGTTAGSIGVSFTAPSNAPGAQAYTAQACTNAAMTTNCIAPQAITSGGQITGLSYTAGSPGTAYYVTITATASTGYLASTSTDVGPQNATSQVTAPTNVTVTPSTTTAGALTVTFTNSSGTAPSSYSAYACTSANMTSGCVGPQTIVSGGQITGLSSGTGYYVGIVANPPTGYVSGESAIVGPYTTTIQLNAPSNVMLSYGTTAGSIGVSFTPPIGAPGGQTYTAKACTNNLMTTACQTQNNFTSGSQFTGLTYTQGSAGNAYYVTITANASSGYLAATSSVAGPQADTSQVNAPTSLTVVPSTTTAGALTVSFTASTGIAPSSYTAVACTNTGMTTGCHTQTSFTSGSQFTGLTAGTGYYVTMTAVTPSTAYVSATTAYVGPTASTIQLNPPTSLALSAGTSSGAIKVIFTGSTNAAPGQTYTATACTNNLMTTGCVTQTAFTSGGQITSLTQGTPYYVTVTANASTGYLAATSTVAGPFNPTVQLIAPSSVTLSYGPTAGSINVTFTAPSNAAPGQTYTAQACTNAGMSTNCITPQAITSGSSITGLTYTQGSPGTAYYVTITANASTGYLAATSGDVGPQNATSQVSAATNVNAQSSTTTAGSIFITFTASTGTAPSSYSAVVCTNAAMTTLCNTTNGYTSGTAISGLAPGTTYYAEIVANPPTGYVSATSAVDSGVATIQLTAPTSVALSAGTTSGSLTVTFNASSNAAAAQTYSAAACTNSGMTLNCVTQASITSGGQFTGLTAGTSYFATVTANASSGYLAATSTVTATSTMATVQLNAPTGLTVVPSTTTAGALLVTFTNSTNAPGSQTYLAKACTGAGMTGTCFTQAITSGSQFTGLTAGTSYYVTVTANASTGYLAATTAAVGPTMATVQLTAPTGVSLSAGTSGGSLMVNFTASSNAAAGQVYSARACTGAGMTGTCLSQASITSGGLFTGLTPGTPYYFTVTANASTGYLVSPASSVAGPMAATTQLNAPAVTSLAYGTTAGSLTVNFSASSNAPGGQTYSARACTGAGMTGTCVTQATITSGAQFTGLAYTQGSAGTAYYVTVTANASTGYLAATSAAVGPQADTSQVNAPTSVTVVPSTITAGSLNVTYVASTGTAPASYTLQYCTGAGMTGTCVTLTSYASGTAITSLTAGATYYATVTAVAPDGYVSATSGIASGIATVQLTAPTSPSLSSGTTAGSLTVNFTASSNAAAGQTYSARACTGAGMTGTCVTQATITSGGQFTGLVGTTKTNYYVTVSANASTGYLASVASSVAGPTAATVQLNAPAVTSLAYGTTAGSLTVNFTASSNAPAGQTYSAEACTGSGMSGTCINQPTITSGGQFTLLGYTQGSAGTAYYVTVTATASAGYLSATSAQAGPQADTSQVNAPTSVNAQSSTTTAGSIFVTYTASTGTAPGSYTLTYCTNSLMTTGCATVTNYASGTAVTGLTAGTTYYVEVTAVAPSSAYVSATSSVDSALATIQLTAPTGVTLSQVGHNTTELSLTFTASSNAAAGQTYTAKVCTNFGMTSGCVTHTGITGGTTLTGLNNSNTYYAELSADPSTGYLVSPESSVSSGVKPY